MAIIKRESRLWLIILTNLSVIQLLAILVYFDDKRFLAELFDRIASATLPMSEQVKEVVGFLREKPILTNDSYFLLPIFSFLRPTARQVATQGGDCADRSRFLVRLLQLRGIKASKWALYLDDLGSQHAIAEVEIESGKMVVDPLFGLWFPRPQGGYYGMKELREHPGILQERIQYLRSHNEQPGAARLEFYPVDKYIYDHARTINWDKSIGMQVLYRILQLIIGGRVNEIPRPGWSEEPALMVVFGLTTLEGSVLVAWLFTVQLKNRKKPDENRPIARDLETHRTMQRG